MDEDGNYVYNSPKETGEKLWIKQGKARILFQGTCGLCSCVNVLRLAGVDVDEKEIVDYASTTNASDSDEKLCTVALYNPAVNGSTSPQDRKEILEHYGIRSEVVEVKRDADTEISKNNISVIADFVEQGRGVIVSIHAYQLWYGKKSSKKDFHAITVTSVKKNAQGNVLGFYVCDTGRGGTYYHPADLLVGALTGLPINVTNQIIR